MCITLDDRRPNCGGVWVTEHLFKNAASMEDQDPAARFRNIPEHIYLVFLVARRDFSQLDWNPQSLSAGRKLFRDTLMGSASPVYWRLQCTEI